MQIAMATLKYTWTFSEETKDNWILLLQYIGNGVFVCSTSSGLLYAFLANQPSNQPLWKVKAHESSINAITKAGDYLASSSTDGVKVWDMKSTKPVFHLTNPKNLTFLSLGYSRGILAGGTELMGVDAELHLWDLTKGGELVRSFIDSHHDDITDIKFHPTDSTCLMSGSTDGYVNIYDLSQEEEEDALHQVINYTSVHSCHFTQPKRVAVLSHMETLSFNEVNDKNYEVNSEPNPKDLGDLREQWPDCEYVIDLKDNWVAYGANSTSKLTVMPFDPISEQFSLQARTQLPNAHGDEVVRDVVLIPDTRFILSCGEDGTVKLWEVPNAQFLTNPVHQEDGKKDKKVKKDKKEKKEQKEKKDKKEKKEKKEKKKKEVRYKPY